MKEFLRARAKELGFDACHVTDARAPDHAAAFSRWLAEGRHGAMSYLERSRERRMDPDRVLPGVRSIVMLAVSYHRTSAPVSRGDGRLEGVVARYARHADYHDVVAPALASLRQYVDELGGCGTRSLEYIDTGPVLERDLAQRAGIGFVGKHTNLISRGLGNWFFLAAILTTVEIEPDAGAVNRCGTCTRCLIACPTQAITEPFRLDARRCISYLTIELRGSIPMEFRSRIGARIFGCDDCLEVCPWNRFAREGRLMRDVYRADLEQASLMDLLSIQEDDFRRRFRGTPFERAKRRGLLRNVAVALGNVGDSSALPALERAGRDMEPLIAEHALWAIERIEGRHGREGRGQVGKSACSVEGDASNVPDGDGGKIHT